MRIKSGLAFTLLSALVLAPASALATTAPAEDASATTAPTASCAPLGDLTVLATTDNHGTYTNYDYYSGQAFGGAGEQNKARGLELLSGYVATARSERGADGVVLLDNGDNNQGNPLESYYHAHRAAGTVDPGAAVLNRMGYDAANVGNHEFNYGLDDLAQYRGNLDMPLLGSNVIERASGKPYLTPYTILHKQVGGKDVKVGVIGVVTPGISIWDADKVKSLAFENPVLAVQKYVPEVRAAGADVVIVAAHTGLDPNGYTWTDGSDFQTDLATSIAQQTSGVDLVIAGHSHSTRDASNVFTNKDGEHVLVTQPGYHGRFLSDVRIPLAQTADGIDVVNTQDCAPAATPVYASDYVGAEDPGVLKAIQPWHNETLTWVDTVVAQATETMSGATSPWEDTAILDFVGTVETEAVTNGLKGTQYEGLPVLAQTSPFSRSAVFPQGNVTIANMAGLYTFDNTLLGVKLTGAQVKDYLEYAAQYYKQVPANSAFSGEDVTNAPTDYYQNGMPDYGLDLLTGVNYEVNISKPVGERIQNLTVNGTPVKDDDAFVLAINNYRQSGGVGYPHVTDAPIVFDQQQAIRDLLIQWAEKRGTIDPSKFAVTNWKLTTSDASPSSTAAPTQPSSSTPTGESVLDITTPSASATRVASAAGNTPGPSAGRLAWTGSNTVGLVSVAALLLGVGVGIARARRRSWLAG
ncbi:bifunctional metallophosphatase/5'-nucleotidase [Neoactinobaculum massilliense]|uniref:bifunctional metallophosphatase/5'-nucleotidase n=1 Tax=Neoactinobaculum massilliense TaxID=2364794 RepID=UPI0013DD9595|nr:5'-nucleotidase C-terminal domain-containing protein [Neoactinobaculum massilliense]